MKTRFVAFLFLLVATSSPAADKITWVGWTDDLFARAKKENKLVILDLEAVWCHWCHVMEEKTYSDAKVISLINSRYIAVRVDQDSRPDLSNRYEDYGWPATIVFGPDGKELVKRSGYIPPENMASLLQAIIDDPTPGPSVVAEEKLALPDSAFLSKPDRDALAFKFVDLYDTKLGGWTFGHKFLPADCVEWALLQTDNLSVKRWKETLAKVATIADPAWGGIYQYSVKTWKEPHFEKIMLVQADAIRIFSLAYAKSRSNEHLKVANATRRFLDTFLTSPEGVFYTSQDADLVPGEHSEAFFKLDDKARRAKGIPRVDKHVYARENGWAIDAYTVLGMAATDRSAIERAEKAANWILANRALSNGGFRHDADDKGRLYLGDTLAMGQAFLRLYVATGDRRWLGHAKVAADYIANTFPFSDANGKRGGFVTARGNDGIASLPQRDENVGVARFTNLLFHYTGEPAHRKTAEEAMRFLSTPMAQKKGFSASLLLVDRELATSPLHVTVVGPKSDLAGKALFEAAQSYPGSYKRVEWWDRTEGNLPRNDITYPELKKPAAFICTNSRCSLPIFEAATLRQKIDKAVQGPNLAAKKS